jgi:hypothetical protein
VDSEERAEGVFGLDEHDCRDSEKACFPHSRERRCDPTMVRGARNLRFRSTRSGVAVGCPDAGWNDPSAATPPRAPSEGTRLTSVELSGWRTTIRDPVQPEVAALIGPIFITNAEQVSLC